MKMGSISANRLWMQVAGIGKSIWCSNRTDNISANDFPASDNVFRITENQFEFFQKFRKDKPN